MRWKLFWIFPGAQSNLLYRTFFYNASAFSLRTHGSVVTRKRQISFCRDFLPAEADVVLSVVVLCPAETELQIGEDFFVRRGVAAQAYIGTSSRHNEA